MEQAMNRKTAKNIVILIVGVVVTVIYCKREFNLDSAGFRLHRFEKDLYRRLNVKKWKLHMITAKPEQFDLERR